MRVVRVIKTFGRQAMKSVITLAISVIFLMTASASAVEGDDSSGRRGRSKVGRGGDGGTDGGDCRDRCAAEAEHAFRLCIKNGGGTTNASPLPMRRSKLAC